MSDTAQLSIEDFLRQLDLDKIIADAEKPKSVARINRKSADRIDRQSTARMNRSLDTGTEGIATRRPPTPTELRLIEQLKAAVLEIDVDKLYVAYTALCQTEGLSTNHTMLWEGKNLSVREFYIKVWIRTVEMAKMIGKYHPNEIGQSWKIWGVYFPAVKPLIDQANAEFAALGIEGQ